ncbi:synaptojanin-2-binding protein isoform X2 [Hydra vulgaris]|uniref:Synaptojanin-2-binding protein isoform X2 n=1 Tax=Hydra vulgaris TaxID=6087 RepID=A0ABM4CJY6_HYDVU
MSDRVHFTIESEDEDEIVEVILLNKYPELQGFGLDISGGTNRPYRGSTGIFVSALKTQGLAEKSGKIEVGDQILKVNGYCVANVTHDEAVKYFISNRNQVTLQLKKKAGQMLNADIHTLSSSVESLTFSEKSSNQENDQAGSSLSLSGFLIGLTLGVLCVMLIKKYSK